MPSVYDLGIVGGEEAEQGDVKNPYAVEMYSKLSIRALLVISLEERGLPVYPIEFEETLSGRGIDKPRLMKIR